MSDPSAVIAEAAVGPIYDGTRLVQSDAEDVAWDVAQAVLAALEEAGYAVVKLPEPREVTDGGL